MEDAVKEIKKAIFEKLKEERDKRKQEREEIGEEAFVKKYPPLTLEEKREKMIEIIKKKHQWKRKSAKGEEA